MNVEFKKAETGLIKIVCSEKMTKRQAAIVKDIYPIPHKEEDEDVSTLLTLPYVCNGNDRHYELMLAIEPKDECVDLDAFFAMLKASTNTFKLLLKELAMLELAVDFINSRLEKDENE